MLDVSKILSAFTHKQLELILGNNVELNEKDKNKKNKKGSLLDLFIITNKFILRLF